MEIQQDLLTDVETEINQEPAPTSIRFANYLIDLVVFYVLNILVSLAFTSWLRSEGRPMIYLTSYCLYIAYFTLIEGATGGRTVGKFITGTKAVKEDGETITWNDALLRSLSRIVPFEPFSAFGGYPWHDRWTHTKVVKINNL
jgi:uncharacterized RDD family membrane protein YckC